MRVARIVNAVPEDHSNETNSDSEPNIAVNPANPLEMAITAFTPPDSGDVNSPVYFSSDGGENWSLLFDVAGDGSLDQTISFAGTSNELFMATIRNDTSPLTFDIDSSDDLVAGVTFPILEPVANVDQPWVRAIDVTSGPDAGKVRTYVGYGDTSSGYWATVIVCLDALAASPAFTKVKLDPRSAQRDGFHIRPAPNPDGTVYVGYQSWQSQSGSTVTMNMVVARDDNWGNNSFGDLKDPSDNLAGRIVASVKINEDMSGNTLGGNRPDNGFDVQVDPNDSDVVYISWIDDSGPGFTLRVRRSLNRGVDWSGDLLTVNNAALATMAINSQSTVALAYLELVSGQWETHFQTTSDGTTWDDTLLARTATNPVGFVGDYMRMIAVGPHFYGVFPAINTPDASNFFPNGGGTLRFQRKTSGGSLVGTDGVTPVTASLDPFFYKVQEFDTTVITDRNVFGKDEIDAMLHQASPAIIGAAFYVTVDGFTANDLGITAATFSGTPNVSPAIQFAPLTAPPLTSLSANPTALSGEDQTNLSVPQRFTWTYDLQFTSDADFTSEDRLVNLTATATSGAGVSVSGNAQLTLTEQPDPYEIDGPVSYLSVDLQVFNLLQGGALPSTASVTLNGTPNEFIHDLLVAYNNPSLPRAPGHPFDIDLVAHESTSAVEIAGSIGGTPVYNFAVARVRYRALSTPSPNVAVFFRIFQASTTATDYQPSTTYANGGTGGVTIPILGVLNGEVVTIPCFAAGRVDPSNAQGLNAQTDPDNIGPLGQPIPPDSTGAEVQVYFGCWLDINQTTAQLPDPNATASAAGPFTPVQSIQDAIRGKHQCLVAEIFLQPPEPQIAVGATPAQSDKLAQRNLNIVGTASPHQIPVTFDLKPTTAALPAGQKPDELMIDWSGLPAGSRASIYLPGASADAILRQARRMYARPGLSRADTHTLACEARGISFIPIPEGVGSNYAGLITVDLPASLGRGRNFAVVARQITNAFGSGRPPPPPPQPQMRRRAAAALAEVREIEWRKVLGSFQISIPVESKPELLGAEERLLSVLRWIEKGIPRHNRWRPVFHRYLQQIAGRVSGLGGNPVGILPSPEGDGGHGRPTHGRPLGRRGYMGKVVGLLFDSFGDFDGFQLDGPDGFHEFFSRERDVKVLAERAWRERLRITVRHEPHQPHRIESIVIHQPPEAFDV
jgi:hypothetical protein